jgi:hypothetical protein
VNLPIDTEKVRFLVSMPPTPVIDRKTDRQAISREGVPLFHVEVVAFPDGSGAEVIRLKIAGEPADLVQHQPARVIGLRAKIWSNKKHTSWLADRVEAADPTGGG